MSRLRWPIALLLAAAGALFALEGLNVLERNGLEEPGPSRPDLGQAHPSSMQPVGKAAHKLPNDWFVLQRAYPGESLDQAARLLALEQARALRARGSVLGGGWTGGSSEGDGSGDAGTGDRNTWTLAGPLNIGGRITALAVHPSMPGRIFAGCADGGIFRSTDGGASWQPVFDEVGNLSIGALAADPSDPAVVYAGTGEANASGDSFAGVGVFRTTDAGESWELLGLEESRHIGRIAVDPLDPDRVFVAATGALFGTNPERGLYRTTDRGQSWEQVLFVSDSTAVIDVALDPQQPDRIFAATWERIRTPWRRSVGGMTSGVWRSTDGGDTWTRLSNGLPGPGPDVGRIGLAVAPSQPSVVYAIYADDPGYFDGLYKSTNSGDTWVRTNDGALSDLYSSYGWFFGNVRVDPTNPNRVFAMGLDIYRSTTGGSSWSYVSPNVHVDQHALWIDPSQPSRMVAGCDGGVYLTSNGGGSWSHVETLGISQFYAGDIDYLNPQRLYGGLQDNGTVRTWDGGLGGWDSIYWGDGFYTLVDPTNSNIIYAEYQWGNMAKSTNGGGSFYPCLSGISSSDRRNWSTPFALDPTNPSVLWYGTYRMYRSTNGASGWSAVSGDLTSGSGGGNLPYGTITTIAVAPSNTSVVYAGTDDARVWRTTNSGGSWQDLSSGLPQRWVTRVAADPSDPNRAYVALSGYREDDPTPHLLRTTNGGAVWTAIDAGLPDAPVNALALDPELGWIYAGTDLGVYVQREEGGAWEDLAPGLPFSVVHDLKLHEPTRVLVAFTHGRSAYRLALPSPSGVVQGGPQPQSLQTDPLHLAVAPNPFGSGTAALTRIEFTLPQPGEGRLELFDLGGRRVRMWPLAHNGRYGQVSFDAVDQNGDRLSAGVYFLRLTCMEKSKSIPVNIVR